MDIQKGDRITFRAPTRYDCRTATRIVSGIVRDRGKLHRVLVRYHGHKNFRVRVGEIFDIEKMGGS
jgi:hypothetical protein|tara:strand:- start:505 stop:702 length:198 start_codon:yes stop_codon:yes gene_type:complete